MAVLPIVSVKSKALQADLGVKSVRAAKEKLVRDFGITLIENEYVYVRELEEIVEKKLKSIQRSRSTVDHVSYLKGSSFEDL